MRVSTNMMSSNFMSSLNKSLERQNKLQEQLSDGKAIHRPSDDPIKTIRSLRFNISLKENEQYTQQVKDATSWMETTDGAMNDLSSLTIKAKELVVKSVSTNPDIAMDAIAEELDGIINQMVEIGNSKLGDRYVFAGQNDKTQPFQRQMVTNADGTQTEAVVYYGDSNKISMKIQPGSVAPSQDSVNLTGGEVFGLQTITAAGGEQVQTAAMLNDLIKIKEALSGKIKQGEQLIAGTPSPQSNPAGGAASQTAGGTHKAFTLRIDEKDTTTSPQPVTKASYSIDGGKTWKSATSNGSGNFTIAKEDAGATEDVKYSIQADDNNQVGDTYSLPLATKARDTAWLSKTGIYLVDAGHDHLLQAETELGARMSMYEQAEALLEKNNVIITGDVSANEDLDIAKAMIDFKTSESIYRTALSIGAKIMPPSLADFLN